MLNKKKLMQEIERERRERLRRQVEQLEQAIKQRRIDRDTAIANIRTGCRAARLDASARCKAAEQEQRAAARSAIAPAKTAERALRTEDRIVRGAERTTRRAPPISVRRAESDDEVRQNIAAEFVPVFDIIRRQIKPGLRKSRTEAFLQWAEENPNEIYALQMAQADRDVAGLVAQHKAAVRLLHKRKLSAEDVPF